MNSVEELFQAVIAIINLFCRETESNEEPPPKCILNEERRVFLKRVVEFFQDKNFDDVSEAQDLWKKFMEVSYFLMFL